MIRLMLIAALCILAFTPAARADALADALERLDTSIERHAGTEPERVLEAAAVLEETLRNEGVATAASELTLGNASFLGGDIGRAILHYRRGLEIDPMSEPLRTNLVHARSFVEPAPKTPGAAPIVERVALAWRGVVDRRLLWWTSIAALALASIALTLRAAGLRRRGLVVATRVSLVALVLGAAPLAAEAWIVSVRDAAVVVEPGIIAYSGPGRGAYDPVYEQALGVGTEGRVVGARRGWVQLALPGGERAWVPGHAVERIAASS